MIQLCKLLFVFFFDSHMTELYGKLIKRDILLHGVCIVQSDNTLIRIILYLSVHWYLPLPLYMMSRFQIVFNVEVNMIRIRSFLLLEGDGSGYCALVYPCSVLSCNTLFLTRKSRIMLNKNVYRISKYWPRSRKQPNTIEKKV